jgi:hypothetical protein
MRNGDRIDPMSGRNFWFARGLSCHIAGGKRGIGRDRLFRFGPLGFFRTRGGTTRLPIFLGGRLGYWTLPKKGRSTPKQEQDTEGFETDGQAKLAGEAIPH